MSDDGLYITPTGKREVSDLDIEKIIEICKEIDLVYMAENFDEMKAEAYTTTRHRLYRILNIVSRWV